MRSVLIVDDEPENLKHLVEMFQHSTDAFTIYQAIRGELALRIVKDKRPDIVITDWEMPEMSGLDLIRQMKKTPETAHIPIIMCTGVMTTSENLRTALEAGAVDYIRKPVDPIELEARVRTVLHLADSLRIIREQNASLEQQKSALEQANCRLTHMSITDPLTGLANRRKFDEMMNQELVEPKDTPLSLIMLDLDHFKSINDKYGHDVGDEVLKKVSNQLQSQIRQSDFLARWGGEEFVILLKLTDLESALKMAEKLRLSLENLVVPMVGNVTASFGVSSGLAKGNLFSLLERADKALYESKNAGRNRVTCA